jgi:hypothetical protein
LIRSAAQLSQPDDPPVLIHLTPSILDVDLSTRRSLATGPPVQSIALSGTLLELGLPPKSTAGKEMKTDI